MGKKFLKIWRTFEMYAAGIHAQFILKHMAVMGATKLRCHLSVSDTTNADDLLRAVYSHQKNGDKQSHPCFLKYFSPDRHSMTMQSNILY